MKVVIVGGVAGGMSAATRLRRLDEEAEIVVLRARRPRQLRQLRTALLPRWRHRGTGRAPGPDARGLATRFGLDVRVRSEVVAIDRAARTVRVRDRDGGREYDEPYDRLVLSPGARPFAPDLPGVERARTLRDVTDVDRVAAGAPRRGRPHRRGGRGRFHRSRGGGEPARARPGRDARRARRPGAAATGRGDGRPARGEAARARHPRGAGHPDRQGAAGLRRAGRRADGPGGPRPDVHRRTPGEQARPGGRPGDRRAWRHRGGRLDAHQRPRHLRRRRRRREARRARPASRRSSPLRTSPTGTAAWSPTGLPGARCAPARQPAPPWCGSSS